MYDRGKDQSKDHLNGSERVSDEFAIRTEIVWRNNFDEITPGYTVRTIEWTKMRMNLKLALHRIPRPDRFRIIFESFAIIREYWSSIRNWNWKRCRLIGRSEERRDAGE